MLFKRNFTKILEARLKEPLNFIQIILGPRQVGKTTAIKQIIESWPLPFIFETADDLIQPDHNWIELQWNRARAINAPVLLVFDEIQKINNWSEAVKKLFDQDRSNKNIKVVLLGSASLSLARGLTESLAGRFETIQATHWTYQECKEAFNWNLNQFLQFGGYPAAQELIVDQQRWQDFMKYSVIEPVISRDILGLTSINKPALFRQTFELCMKYPAQEVSLNKILGSLQDKGNITTIRHYLDLFEGAFLLKTISKYSGSELSKKSSMPKLLPLAPALIHALNNPSKVMAESDWRGRIFEVAVGVELFNINKNIFYWREGNYEIDYVMLQDDIIYAIEVKSGRRKNTTGLQKFISKYPNAVPIVINSENFEILSQTKDIKSCI
jgi:predicted AAA+ superfamily ATPase